MELFTKTLRLFWREPLGMLAVAFHQLLFDKRAAVAALDAILARNEDLR